MATQRREERLARVTAKVKDMQRALIYAGSFGLLSPLYDAEIALIQRTQTTREEN